MTDTAHEIATSANLKVFNQDRTRTYREGSPHVKQRAVWRLCLELLKEVYGYASRFSPSPRILDLGAGEGTTTTPLLQFGATVTAVDISQSQLDELRKKCERFGAQLQTERGDVFEILGKLPGPYDVVVMNAFLHHVPDYHALIRLTIPLLADHGQLFTFQDPLRYDSITKFNRTFSQAGYFSWRLFQGDIWGGFQRLARRRRGIYLEDSEFDNAEYHVTRNGVDQDSIAEMLTASGFDARIVRYFSTQGSLLQPIGEVLHLANTFGIVARKAA